MYVHTLCLYVHTLTVFRCWYYDDAVPCTGRRHCVVQRSNCELRSMISSHIDRHQISELKQLRFQGLPHFPNASGNAHTKNHLWLV